tara:strand:- start:47 stop:310 length:264 start_codon:yes stop_codon:yes gene_type:complete
MLNYNFIQTVKFLLIINLFFLLYLFIKHNNSIIETFWHTYPNTVQPPPYHWLGWVRSMKNNAEKRQNNIKSEQKKYLAKAQNRAWTT